MTIKSKYLFALSGWPNPKGFCHRTILVSGTDENDARSAALNILKERGETRVYLGKPKKVDY